MREAWGRLQAPTASHLSDADARMMEQEVEAASGSQKELTAFLDQANNSRLRNDVCALPVTCRERILFNQLDAASGMWTVAIPTARTVMTPHELREVAARYFFLPSRPCLAPVVGSQIILPSTEHNPVTVDLYSDALMNLPAHEDAHWRVQHDAIADAFRDHCVHDLGIVVRREVDDLFQHAVPLGNTVPMDELKDLVPDAELSLPAFNVVTGSYDPRSLKSSLLELKTMRAMVLTRSMRTRAAGSGCAELSADEWELVAEQLRGADGGSWRGVLRGVCRAARNGLKRAAAAAEGGTTGGRRQSIEAGGFRSGRILLRDLTSRVELLQWAVEQGCALVDDGYVVNEALAGGRLEVLQWGVQSRGWALPRENTAVYTSCLAAKNGHLEVLKWLGA
eukprot:jgi/Tetstr1/434279/TSEL_023386.t1